MTYNHKHLYLNSIKNIKLSFINYNNASSGIAYSMPGKNQNLSQF